MRRSECYGLLGLREGASPGQIKEAFRRRAKLVHPDLNTSPEAHEAFLYLTEAYRVLRDRSSGSSHALVPADDARRAYRPAPQRRWRHAVAVAVLFGVGMVLCAAMVTPVQRAIRQARLESHLIAPAGPQVGTADAPVAKDEASAAAPPMTTTAESAPKAPASAAAPLATVAPPAPVSPPVARPQRVRPVARAAAVRAPPIMVARRFIAPDRRPWRPWRSVAVERPRMRHRDWAEAAQAPPRVHRQRPYVERDGGREDVAADEPTVHVHHPTSMVDPVVDEPTATVVVPQPLVPGP